MSTKPWFIVEIDAGCWLATWSGDPGRTCRREHARQYPTEHGARIGLGMARRHRALKNARIVEVQP